MILWSFGLVLFRPFGMVFRIVFLVFFANPSNFLRCFEDV